MYTVGIVARQLYILTPNYWTDTKAGLKGDTTLLTSKVVDYYTHCEEDEKEGRKKQARSNKHTQGT